MTNTFLNIKGVRCAAIAAGIKQAQNSASNSNPLDTDKLDLALIVLSDDAQTAAVFTQNVFCAAPVIVAKNHLNHPIRALIVNSGNANAGTGVGGGSRGLENAYQICQWVAAALGIAPEQVLPFSTGVIGQRLPMACFEDNIQNLVMRLSAHHLPEVARAILTTDLVEKTTTEQIQINGKTVTISGMSKGSGMIRPDMATMLGFIFTDIEATSAQLQTCLSVAVDQSFNRITVDGDTSTNDACTLSATATSGVNIAEGMAQFQQALNKVAQTLAHKIIKDGEGATKFVEICVRGGASQRDCLEVAYTVAHSPLVKTALFASDANWGRILAAVGRANIAALEAQAVSIYLNEVRVICDGEIDTDYTESLGSAEMAKTEIVIGIVIGNSARVERVWTCDLSHDYIRINAEYRS